MIDDDTRARHEPTSAPALLTFGLIPSLHDFRVHAVYDPTYPFPEPVCGMAFVPGIWLPRAVGPVMVCRRCTAAIPDPDKGVELRPAAEIRQRHLAAQPDYKAWPVLELARRHAARRYDRRVHQALAEVIAA